MGKIRLKKGVGMVEKATSALCIGRGVIYSSFLFIIFWFVVAGDTADVYLLLATFLVIIGIVEYAFYKSGKDDGIEFGEGKIYIRKKVHKLNRYGNDTGEVLQIQEEFHAKEVEKIDYTEKLYKFLPYYEKYRYKYQVSSSSEITFMLKQERSAAKNFGQIMAGDKQKIFRYIHARSGVVPEQDVLKRERIMQPCITRVEYHVMKRYEAFNWHILYPMWMILTLLMSPTILIWCVSCFSLLLIAESVIRYHGNRESIVIGEERMIVQKTKGREKFEINEIEHIKLGKEQGEILFILKSGVIVSGNIRGIYGRKEIFYYIYLKSGKKPDENVCERYRLNFEED